MIELIEGLPANVVGIAVKGRVTSRDCRDVLAPAVARTLRRRDRIRLYYEISSRFPGAGWDDLDLGLEHAAWCERVAIVTDIAWISLTLKALRFLIPGDVRVFSTIQTAEGRAWIAARPGSRADTQGAATLPPRPLTARRLRRAAPALSSVAMPAQADQPGHTFV
ncbi:MAG: STAS/SEC14 domain-containing protein [Stellaceae bacterium]